MAKTKYVIDEFISNNGQQVYKLKESDKYYYLQGTPLEPSNKKGLLDFLCNYSYKIKSVTIIKDNITNTFTIGERITRTDGGNNIIKLFRITQNNYEVVLDGGINYSLNNISKYVEPIVVPAVKMIKNKNTKEQHKDIFTLENKILSLNTIPIRLEKTLKKRKETPKEFLIKFFTDYNNEKNTIYCDTLIVQTATGKRRSLGDIFMIMRYYYPDITLTEVLTLLYNTLPNYFGNGFRTSYCNTIKKRVWYYNKGFANGNYSPSTLDEYGYNSQWYESKL